MCITPLTLKRPKEEHIEHLPETKTRIVPCGKCFKCLQGRQKSWAFRLMKEAASSQSACFMTLTYEKEPLSFNGHATLQKADLQKFIKRLRKKVNLRHRRISFLAAKKNRPIPPQPKLKYYAVGEYGTRFKRPHYHLILFNLPQYYIQNSEILATTIWKNGIVHIGNCTTASAMYTASYVIKGVFKPEQDDDDREPEFSTMSKGMGISYLTPAIVNYHLTNKIPYLTLDGGVLQSMPRYYKDKIFSKSEKAMMAHEAKLLRELDLNEWLDFDFSKETSEKKNKIRRHEKEHKLKSLKL